MNRDMYSPAQSRTSEGFAAWFMNKLFMGMSVGDYSRSLITPFNLLAASILATSLPIFIMRYSKGLASVLDATNEYPWGLLLSWGIFAGEPLFAAGFVVAAGYYLFGMQSYRPLVRLAVLGGISPLRRCMACGSLRHGTADGIFAGDSRMAGIEASPQVGSLGYRSPNYRRCDTFDSPSIGTGSNVSHYTGKTASIVVLVLPPDSFFQFCDLCSHVVCNPSGLRRRALFQGALRRLFYLKYTFCDYESG